MDNNVLHIKGSADLAYLSEKERIKYLKILEKEEKLDIKEKEDLKKLKRKITNKKHYVKKMEVGKSVEVSNKIEENEGMATLISQLSKIMEEIGYLKTINETNYEDRVQRGEVDLSSESVMSSSKGIQKADGAREVDGGMVHLIKLVIPILVPASIMVILILGQIPIYRALDFGRSMSVLIAVTTQFATVGLWFLSERKDLKNMKDLKAIAVLLSIYVVVSNGASVFEREGRENRVILSATIADLDNEIMFLNSEVVEYRKKKYSARDRREKENLLYGDGKADKGLLFKRRERYGELLKAGGPIDKVQQYVRIWTVIILKALLELSCIYFTLCLSKRSALQISYDGRDH